MKKVDRVELGLENCEVVSIPLSAIGCLEIEGVHHRIRRVVKSGVFCGDIADEVFIEIVPEANELGTIWPKGSDRGSVIERLISYCDIVAISLVYEDGTARTVYVQYDPGDNDALEAGNIFQKHYISANNVLYIVISASGKSVEDYCDKDFINAPNYRSVWQEK